MAAGWYAIRGRRMLATRRQVKRAFLAGGERLDGGGYVSFTSIFSKPLEGADRFLTEPRLMVYGRPKHAVLGIQAYMQVDANTVRQGMQEGVAAIEREIHAYGSESDKECLHYVLHEAAGSNAKTFQDGLKRDCDSHGELLPSRRLELPAGGYRPMILRDFCEHPFSEMARLETAHVVALRLYSTAAFHSINAPLRELAGGHRSEPHRLPITVAFIEDGVKRLRAVMARETASGISTESAHIELTEHAAATTATPRRVSHYEPAIKAPQVLYRGMRDVTMSPSFFKDGGTVRARCRGFPTFARAIAFFRCPSPTACALALRGCLQEVAPMSTTADLEVAVRYAMSANSVLLRLATSSFIKCGADISYLSAFPAESEYLYPPLSFLQPTGAKPIRVTLDRHTSFLVVDVEPHL